MFSITGFKGLPRTLLLAVLVLLGATVGQASAGDGPSLGQESTGFIEGTVFSEGGRGVGEVIVSTNGIEATTHFDGTYRLGPLPAGDYTLTLRDPARRFVRLDNPRTAPKATVVANSTVEKVNATMRPEPRAVGHISGRVGGAGSAKDAATFVDAFLIDGDRYYNVATAPVISDKYAMAGLPEGKYVVRVSRYEYNSGRYQRAYYQGGTADGPVSLFELRVAEARKNVDLAFEAAARAAVAGLLVNEVGAPAIGVEVELLDRDRLTRETVTTDEKGRFEIRDVAPDRYRLKFHDPKGRYDTTFLGSDTLLGSRTVRLSEGDNDLIEATLTGTARVAGRIDVSQDAGKSVLLYVEVYRTLPGGGFEQVANHQVDQPGDFNINGVPSGDLRFAVRAYDPESRSATVAYYMGAQSVRETPSVAVAPGQDADDIQFFVGL